MNEEFNFTPEMEALMLQEDYFAGIGETGDLAVDPMAFAIGGFVFIVIYLYVSFALMTMAKKMKEEKPWLAFIPVANLYLMSKMAKMHWWPAVLIIFAFIPIIGQLLSIVVSVFAIIWMWKIFEHFKRPGWWSVLQVIPLVNLVYLVLLGKVAWGSEIGEVKKIKEEEVALEEETIEEEI
jgi:hypothetical protein